MLHFLYRCIHYKQQKFSLEVEPRVDRLRKILFFMEKFYDFLRYSDCLWNTKQ